jgi:hypothetical protein
LGKTRKDEECMQSSDNYVCNSIEIYKSRASTTFNYCLAHEVSAYNGELVQSVILGALHMKLVAKGIQKEMKT